MMTVFLKQIRLLLSGVLLAGILVAPGTTVAEPPYQTFEQRFPVTPPPPQPVKITTKAIESTPRERAVVKVQTVASSENDPPIKSAKVPESTEQEPRLGYAEAIQMALTAAPQFKATKLDVEIVKLGEKDAWYRLFPKLNMSASYDTPLKNSDSGSGVKPYTTVSFSTGAYDPIAAYIGHDASKVATQLAESMHLQTIQAMMEHIGLSYISLGSQEKLISCRKALRELARRGQEFAAQRAEKGSFSPLDQRLADLKSTVSQMELEHDKNQLTMEMIRLKGLLGIEPERKVVFNTTSLSDIVGDQGTLALPSFSEVEQRNVDFKIMKLREKLQTYNVRLAQAEHLPKFSFGLRTPDPTAVKENDSPYYLTFSASIPIWSWGETTRNVERAELTGQKIAVTNAIQIRQAKEAWLTTNRDLNLLRGRLTIATTTRELRELEAKRESIKHKAGNASFDSLLTAQTAAIHAKMAEVKAHDDYSKARLKLRIQSGELLNQHVRVDHAPVE